MTSGSDVDRLDRCFALVAVSYVNPSPPSSKGFELVIVLRSDSIRVTVTILRR